MNNERKHIAVLAGGYSSEYVVSIESATYVIKSIDPDRFECTMIVISKNGWYAETDEGQYPIDKNNFSFQMNGSPRKFDAVFNSIHGTPGEDGKLQSYFELLNVPVSGCDSFCSSLTFNKFNCNTFLKSMGMPIAQSILIRKSNDFNPEEILKEVGLPCFVKPNSGGSSFGINKVTQAEDLLPAIEKAFKEDREVLAEAFLNGTEITCGLMKSSGKLIFFPLTEIVSNREFFDYEAKYTPGVADEITPARVSDTVKDECYKLSEKAYNLLNCKGLVRMDYILVDKQLFFLEVNTVPGMTKTSLVPQQVEEMGMTMRDVYSLILDDTLKTVDNQF